MYSIFYSLFFKDSPRKFVNGVEDLEAIMNAENLRLEDIGYEGNRDGIIIIEHYILYLLIHTKKKCNTCILVF